MCLFSLDFILYPLVLFLRGLGGEFIYTYTSRSKSIITEKSQGKNSRQEAEGTANLEEQLMTTFLEREQLSVGWVLLTQVHSQDNSSKTRPTESRLFT